jgi:cytochrome c-type biogenesis protein CcsB
MIIDFPLVERFCANLCFVILFLTTLYYWSKIIFRGETSYTPQGLVGFGTTVCFLTLHLVLRWIESGHFPLSNLYESLLFLAWCFLILHIFIENSTKTLFLGVLTSPALLCLIAFTDFSLPSELQRSGPLVPALQSNWLVMHVTVMIASYAALLLGCLISIAYLIFSSFTPAEKNRTVSGNEELEKLSNSSNFSDAVATTLVPVGVSNGPKSPILLSQNLEIEQRSPNNQYNKEKKASDQTISPNILMFLDNLSYRTIGIGFCFLTLGILSGAVWANETWGNYWSWDPKETWAFITWLTFASYLHSRLIGGWVGSRPAWIASFGFVIVWVCYLGVNLLGQGLHSYGFLQV